MERDWTKMSPQEIEEYFDRSERRFVFWLFILGVIVIALVAALTAGCTLPPPPQPPQPPRPPVTQPPGPPGRVCNPGEVCGCWHQPPGQDWQKLPDCTQPACAQEADLVVAELQSAAQLTETVKAAMQAVSPDPKGKPPQETLALLAAKLVEGGRCAIAGQEAVFVRRGDGLFEEYHAVNFGSGEWTYNGKFMGVHRLKTSPPPSMPPPSVGGCTAPLPDKDPTKLHIELKECTKWCDATLQAKGTCTYCQQIGLGYYGDGTMRCGCPMRAECEEGAGRKPKCEERSACEAYVGAPVWETKPAGRPIELRQGNPWVARCDGCIEMRVCINGLVCSEWRVAP